MNLFTFKDGIGTAQIGDLKFRLLPARNTGHAYRMSIFIDGEDQIEIIDVDSVLEAKMVAIGCANNVIETLRMQGQKIIRDLAALSEKKEGEHE